MTALRAISPRFMADLTEPNGRLRPVVTRILSDDTLMLGLRRGYVNIYYRGGNILRLRERSGGYSAEFEVNYFKGEPVSDLPKVKTVKTAADVSVWLKQFPALKTAMDRFLTTKRATEREFQQLVAWENNRSPISNETEYFITDIEFAEGNARLDMLGARWLGHQRSRERSLAPVLIEMKYGTKALGTKALGTDAPRKKSGLLDHLNDIERIIRSPGTLQDVCDTIEMQFEQLKTIGLLKYNQSSRFKFPRMSNTRPQVIFLLANCNPRSAILQDILPDLEGLQQKAPPFDVRFFVAAFAGYGMHEACMLDTQDFTALVKSLLAKKMRK